MTGLFLAGFVIAFGFVTAAIATCLYSWVFSRSGTVFVSFKTIQQAAFGTLFFMISGPYLVLSNGMSLWRKGNVPAGFFGFCMLTSILWSFCLGILVLQLVMAFGLAG